MGLAYAKLLIEERTMKAIPITKRVQESINSYPVMQEVTIDAAGKVAANFTSIDDDCGCSGDCDCD